MIHRQLVVSGVRPILRERSDAFWIGMPELVDALVVVPHNEEFSAELFQAVNHLLVAVVQVLILVDQEVSNVQLIADVRIPIEKIAVDGEQARPSAAA